MYFDPMYFVFALPGLIIGVIAQILLKTSYSKNSKISAGTNITVQQAAELLNNNENFGVTFKVTKGKLNDYFDPTRDLVNLSSDNATNGSVANIAVVAHEFGHVQQKKDGSGMFKVRSKLVPIVNIGSSLGIILFFIGMAVVSTGLIWVGLALFATTTIFSLITLPIELDASRRGMNLIKKHNLIEPSKLGGAKSVLRGAALTYFAGLVASIGQLLYFVMIAQGGGRRS